MAAKKKCWLCWGMVCSPILAIVAVVCLVAAILLPVLVPSKLDSMVEEKVTLQPGHATYEQLKDPTLPVWKSLYFFNLTNPDDFQDGAAPVVKELGPYSYRESRVKQFLEMTENKTRLIYNQTKSFHFDPATSGPGLHENDSICTINLPLVAAVAQLQTLSGAKKIGGIVVLKSIFLSTGAKLYMCVAARDLAWNFTTHLVAELHTNVILKEFKMNYPHDWVSIQLNNSINDTRNSIIHTGVGHIDMLGQYVQWDGNYQKMNIWLEDTANYINGTEGLFFRPLLEEGEDLEAFVDDVFRSFPLVYSGKVKHKGLRAYRYKLPLSAFESAFNNPANARWGSWNPDGLLYLGVIQYPTVPVFGSKPHFLDGDDILREKVKGLQPNRALHDTTIDVEPVTGANIQFKKQLQINVQVNRTGDFAQLEHVNGTLYYPIFYVDEHAELTDAFKSYLEHKGLHEYQLATKLIWVVFALLLLSAVVSAVLSMVGCGLCSKELARRRRGRIEETTPLLSTTEKDHIN